MDGFQGRGGGKAVQATCCLSPQTRLQVQFPRSPYVGTRAPGTAVLMLSSIWRSSGRLKIDSHTLPPPPPGLPFCPTAGLPRVVITGEERTLSERVITDLAAPFWAVDI